MGNKETTLQHTVPVCYLANFGVDGNKKRDSRLCFYDIQNNNAGECKVERLAAIKNFYDVETFNEKKKVIDEAFVPIEGELATLLHNLLDSIIVAKKDKNSIFLQIDKKQLSAQFAMLMTRTQAFRNYYKNIYYQIKNGFSYVDIPQYSQTDFQRIHTSAIFECDINNCYSALFTDWNWLFLINHTELPFITSDNPVIEINHSDKINVSMAGAELTYFVPLSPTVAVEIYHKDILNRDLMLWDIRETKYIVPYNKSIIKNCTRFLYSNKSFEELKQARAIIDDET